MKKIEDEDMKQKQVEQNNKNAYIGSLHDAQDYEKDNLYIHHGYRINYNTPILILKSLFHKHNELVNVWTHLIAGFITICVIIYVSLYFTSKRVNQDEIINDLDKILDISKYSNVQNDTPNINNDVDLYYSKQIKQLIDEFTVLENILFTPETYYQLIQKIIKLKETFQISFDLGDDKKESNLHIITSKLENIKQKLIYQIDSEQFNWMEIYKYDYNWVNEKIVYSKLFPRNPTDPLRISRWPIFVFLISALMCLFGSSMFHLFYQMNQKANKYLMRVDYSGISLLILGSSFPPFYYGFYCDPFIRNLYLFIVGIACFSAYFVSIFDFIHTEPWRRVKGAMYGSLGIFAGIPGLHLYITEQITDTISDKLTFQDSIIFYLLMGASYLGGLVFYVKRIPEIFWPGKFDILGHSHQIWHIFVFLGIIFSYVGAIDNLNERRSTPCLLI